jgi:hypothetical protein
MISQIIGIKHFLLQYAKLSFFHPQMSIEVIHIFTCHYWVYITSQYVGYWSIHGWGIKKRKKDSKIFLGLLSTNNIYETNLLLYNPR